MDLGQELNKASKSAFRLWLLNRIMWRVVPFNKPHKIDIVAIRDNSIKIRLPYRKKNFNHIKGIHACALATLSEYITGLSMLRFLSPKDYRLIMKSIKMDYFYQAKQDVFATFEIDKEKLFSRLEANLEKEDSAVVPLTVEVFDAEKNHICTGNVDWHIKPWKKVKTRL
ncbi:MAG: DUF4442 domain-containing protein [Bacteroidia bacterium]|nr:DUF4442 domain-containing protein [Bacteroidia bacterium]NNC86131.1 DUF4442 domain-containing protein [Bacteroidia bacterium]NNM16574.1 DUF4442 domain-containing protein [Bacteroidia bacterium]